MRISLVDNPRAVRRLALLGGAVALLGLFGAVVVLRSSSSARLAGAPAKPQPSARRDVLVPSGAFQAKPSAVPARIQGGAELGSAMDQSNARQLLRTLVQAAASGNESLRDSMIGALARSPGSPRVLIESELLSTSVLAVREALEKALARCP